MSEFRPYFVAPARRVSAEAERDRMIARSLAAGRAERAPLSSDLQRGVAPVRPLSANEARDLMIRRSR